MEDYTTSAQAYAESNPLPVRPWIVDGVRKALARAQRVELVAAVEDLKDDLLRMTASVCDDTLAERLRARGADTAAPWGDPLDLISIADTFAAPPFPELAAA